MIMKWRSSGRAICRVYSYINHQRFSHYNLKYLNKIVIRRYWCHNLLLKTCVPGSWLGDIEALGSYITTPHIPSGARLGLAQLGSWVHFGRECAPKFLCHPTSHPAIRPTKDRDLAGCFPQIFEIFLNFLIDILFKLLSRVDARTSRF